jgi:hypothetical protein
LGCIHFEFWKKSGCYFISFCPFWGILRIAKQKTSRNRSLSLHHMQTDSGAQPATGYGVYDWVLILSRERNFSLLHYVLIDSGTQPIPGYEEDD